jgi:hypothetical protein
LIQRSEYYATISISVSKSLNLVVWGQALFFMLQRSILIKWFTFVLFHSMDQGCAIDHLKALVTPVCENITNHLFRAGAQYCLAKIEFLCVFHSFNCLVKLTRRFSARSLILRFENCLLLNHVTFHKCELSLIAY